MGCVLGGLDNMNECKNSFLPIHPSPCPPFSYWIYKEHALGGEPPYSLASPIPDMYPKFGDQRVISLKYVDWGNGAS